MVSTERKNGIFTVGHGTMEREAFVDLLQRAGIDLVVDNELAGRKPSGSGRGRADVGVEARGEPEDAIELGEKVETGPGGEGGIGCTERDAAAGTA